MSIGVKQGGTVQGMRAAYRWAWRWVLLPVILVLAAPGVSAQVIPQQHIDSLVALLDTTRTDTTQMRLNASLGNLLTHTRQHGPYLQRALQLAKRFQEHPLEEVRRKAGIAEAQVWNLHGVVHWEDQRFAEALACYQRYRELALQLDATDLLMLAANNIGLLLNTMGLPEKAMLEYKAGLDLAKRHDDRSMLSTMLGRIGDTYMRFGDTARADSHLLASINTSPDPFWSAPARLKLAELRLMQARPEESLPWVISVKAMCEQDVVDGPTLLGYAYFVQARSDTAMGRVDLAFQRLDTCIQRTLAKSIAQWCSRCLLMRAALFAQTNDTQQEEADLLHVLQLSHGKKLLVERSRAAQQLKSLYARQGRTADELRITDVWRSIGDSLYAMDAQKALMVLDFKKASRADSVAYLIKQNAIDLAHANELGEEQGRRAWLLAALLLAAGAAVGIWARMRTMRRANAAVQAAQAQVLEVEKQREAENVRTRIARDIHDDMGGDLTKIGMLSSEAQRLIATDSGSASAALARIATLSRAASISLHEVVNTVDPRSDTVGSVVDHAKAVAARLLEGVDARVDLRFSCTGPQRTLDPVLKRDLLLVMKEAVNNTLKYADATTISVQLTVHDTSFDLAVQDDGRGFDTTTAAHGNGLRNMRSRAASMKASFVLESSPGGGCRIQVTGPLR